ncbi:AGE family epimerase/isomerase [Persicobacter diffluens]|uniref:N-acylglucosamine 2-epimerase n=1 Tax=Persicobacter diffluens TaxID=981 RepID=A0AAN4W2G8_9BACT|nr:hypothetical protein PEDI_38370 [Persicobacter diffluens]
MKIRISVIGFLLISLLACQREKAKPISKVYSNYLENLVGFFEEHAWDAERKVYLSEIDIAGKSMSNRVYNVAHSRMIYGLALASDYYEGNLERASELVQFQWKHLVNMEEGYFYPMVDEDNAHEPQIAWDVWQQAYGLCGLSEYYRKTGDAALLKKIHVMHDGFINRFHDEKNGGFWAIVDREGGVKGSKTLQSLMYPVTAYMGNLWQADVAHAASYEPYIRENLEIAAQSAWNAKTNWVNFKFDDAWNPCLLVDEENLCFTVSPGHNFQLASLFLRAKYFSFLEKETIGHYEELGRAILKATLAKPIYPEGNLANGFYSKVNPLTNEVLDDRKTWWQHAEAILALSLAGKEFEKERLLLESFFFNHFADTGRGGEYFYVTAENAPVIEEWKGSVGKSIYHSVEMIRFLMEQN